MPTYKSCLTGHLSLICLACSGQLAVAQESSTSAIDEIVVWGNDNSARAGELGPSTLLTPQDLVSINVATTEDVVKYEPSLVIRRRFIGDSNGTMGIRGSNMFQTSRSMVFADGVPLHYLLQSRWNGAPRWTMVSASEIAQVEVLYGPFSAEYSGNSMGGVVLIESAIPQEREFHFDSSYFAQNFDAYGFDDTVTGYKSFFSYGDKIGDLSVYLSYNRLENESQPQSFYYGNASSAGNATPVSGGIFGNDERGNEQLFFGDTGIINTSTNNYKFKAGYEIGDWKALLNVAYEDRNGESNSPNSYFRDASGSPLWSGNVVQDGKAISIPGGRLGVSELNRDSLSVGLRLQGSLTETISLETNLNKFQVLHDEDRASQVNPADPAFTTAGQITRFGDTGWQSAEAKLIFDELGIEGMQLVTGARYDSYELNLDVFDSDNYLSGSRDRYTSRSGGETQITALFAQLSWLINSQWDVSLGGRYESFKSDNGYYSQDDLATENFDLLNVPGQSRKEFSPKFSLGYQADEAWRFRYSLGKAYRFPIVEELFSQYQAFNSINEANPELKPENGLHHNFMVERAIDNGFVRLNLFQENIKDVIEAQSTTVGGGTSVRTFVPVDEIETKGIEFIVNSQDLLVNNLDIRFNITYTDSKIVKNLPDPGIEDNFYPRMPEWRGNLLATYHLTENWDAGLNYQYAGNSFGRLDNADKEHNVYGAQDGYSRVGLKTNYNFTSGVSFGLGIDNLTDEIAYVAHPWPGRTLYMDLSYDF